MPQSPTTLWPVDRYTQGGIALIDDHLAVEEPLEIQIQIADHVQPLAITMRTPGHDHELAVGFLISEGVLQKRGDLLKIEHVRDDEEEANGNRIRATLSANLDLDLETFSRHTFTSSSCGICGKQTIERIRQTHLHTPEPGQPIPSNILQSLPRKLNEAQDVFQQTGGLHAVGYFDNQGNLQAMREDVGRHNALDKLIGARFLEDTLPFSDGILLLSGRASFELVQKACSAGISKIAAIGAPSSLAVQLAREFGMTLVGFLRHNRFNLYTGDLIKP